MNTKHSIATTEEIKPVVQLIWAKSWDQPQAHFWCWWWTHLLNFSNDTNADKVRRKALKAQKRLLVEHGVDADKFSIVMQIADVYGDGVLSRVLTVVASTK